MNDIAIIDYKHPAIRQKAQTVNKFDHALAEKINNLKLALATSQPPGVGIASNQIGQTDRLFLIKFGKNLVPFINPQVVSASMETTTAYEGCLSVPKMFGAVKRARQITIQAQTATGKPIEKTYRGLAARIFQHELDHIEGKLFIDRVVEQQGKLLKVGGKDKQGKDIVREVKYPQW